MHEGDTLSCTFRFHRLTEAQVVELQEKCPKAMIVEPRRDREGQCVAHFELAETESETYAWLLDFIRDHAIRVGEWDVLISLVSEYDTGTAAVPDHVRDLVQELDPAGLTFSYTII